MGVDPGTGKETVVGVPEDEAPEYPTEDDPHLLLYGVLRDEIRARITSQQRSLLSGLSLIGVILAYALLSGEFEFLAVIPILIGFLTVQTVQQLNGILYVASHLARIERDYVDAHPLFAWELRYGMVGTERSIRRWRINWTVVPQSIVLILAGLGYIGSVYAAYVVWPPQGVDILAIGLTRNVLLVIYMFVTALVGVAGYSFYLHQEELTSIEELDANHN